ncbi:hypothetical protein QEN19_001294 [Hanseniaspora menglaensis]
MSVSITPKKILCLHGFLQNGKMFSEKSSGIRKLLKKENIHLDYLDGPITLTKTDLPFVIDDEKWAAIEEQDTNKAWFYHFDQSHKIDIHPALNLVKTYIEENGPYDGIMGFSQGAALASILVNQIKELVPAHPFFKVCILFSGYSFTEKNDADELIITEKYVSFYKKPEDENMNTEILSVHGASDNAVPGERSLYLNKLLQNTGNSVKSTVHEGGHVVVNKKDFLRPMVEDIKKALE